MTIETGSKRHGRYVSEAVPVPAYPGDPATVPGEPVWETHRVPDAVRAAALANAVDLVCHYGDMDGARLEDQAVAMARTFEAYLVGETEDSP